MKRFRPWNITSSIALQRHCFESATETDSKYPTAHGKSDLGLAVAFFFSFFWETSLGLAKGRGRFQVYDVKAQGTWRIGVMGTEWEVA
jgi:hypothetical protein